MRLVLKQLFIAALAVITSFLYGVAGDAGQESQFNIGSGVRAVGIGGGLVGLADDASTVFWNPAGLSLLDSQELDLMHATLFEGSIYDVGTFVYPNRSLGGFGISFMRLGTGDIIKRQDWVDMGEFSYSTWQVLLGYGRKLDRGFSLGTSLKIVNQSMDNNSTYGVGLDLAFLKTIGDRYGVGLTFQDVLAPKLRLGAQSETFPMTVLGGIGAKNIPFGDNLQHTLGLGVEKTERRALKIHAGIESVYRGYLALRAGYDRDNFTFGFGVTYQRIRLNYAYRFMDDITDSHRLGLSIMLGTPLSQKAKLEKELESARGSSLILEDHRRQFRFYKDMADKYYRSNWFDSSYAYYQRALAFDPSDRDVKGRIDQIDQLRLMAAERTRRESLQQEKGQPVLDSYYSQAEAFFNKGSYTASLDMINTGLGISPDNKKFIDLRNKVFESRDMEIRKIMDDAARAEKEERYADAILDYNRVLDLSPGNTAVKELILKDGNELNNAQLISKGAESFANGNLSDARRRFEEVLKTDPENLVAKDYLQRISSLMEEATELEVLQKDEKVWKIYLDALEYFRNGDYQNAINLWEEVLKYYPGNKNTINNIEQAKLRLQSEKK